jgi:signal transduction histidine kinase
MFLRKCKMPDFTPPIPSARRPAPSAQQASPQPGSALRWNNRLYLRIFFAMLGSLLIAALMFAIAVRIAAEDAPIRESLMILNEFVAESLPANSKPVSEQRAILLRWQQKLKINISLYDPQGQLITSVGDTVLPLPKAVREGSTALVNHQGLTLKLADGRWLVAKSSRTDNRMNFPLGWTLLLITLAIALAAYPIVRRLTRRLEQLQHTVDNFGRGQLTSRIQIEGKDEIASLGASFNQAAQRIESLVAAQKTLLANASHELRSPLTRIRMAVELLDTQGQGPIADELKQNIVELDQLIDEILLSSRLDAANSTALDIRPVDFTALLAEECARVQASLEAPAQTLACDAKLMRRLVRNLLENARRYGADSTIEVKLSQATIGTQLQLDVRDHGPGIPESQREAIFDAFYRLPGSSERAGGVGLGLSLVRQIAQQHGGSVHCLANTGGGSCFRVLLPLSLLKSLPHISLP